MHIKNLMIWTDMPFFKEDPFCLDSGSETQHPTFIKLTLILVYGLSIVYIIPR